MKNQSVSHGNSWSISRWGMRKLLFCPLQRDILDEPRDGEDGFSDSSCQVGFWRRSEVQRDVVSELSDSDATRCSPVKVQM